MLASITQVDPGVNRMPAQSVCNNSTDHEQLDSWSTRSASYSRAVNPAAGSGDIAEVLYDGPDRAVVVVADVSGRGPAAARVARYLRNVVDALRRDPSPSSILKRVNRTLVRHLADGSSSERFASMFLGCLHDGALTYASAGHDCALLFDGRGRVRHHLGSTGLLLGVQSMQWCREITLEVAAGDSLVLATDGVTDARDQHGRFFGTRGVALSAVHSMADGSEDVAKVILDAALQHAGGLLEDDASVLHVKFSVHVRNHT